VIDDDGDDDRLVAKGTTPAGSGGGGKGGVVIAKGVITIAGDPGYDQTAVMISEAALCLALDSSNGKLPSKDQGGLMTPATAMGQTLIDRLNKAGISFTIATTTT